MSVLIKGMKKPDNCEICPYAFCHLDTRNCPIAEIPDHGDLIDRDALRKDWRFSDSCNRCGRDAYRCQYYEEMSVMDVCGMIDDAPVVISAERIE